MLYCYPLEKKTRKDRPFLRPDLLFVKKGIHHMDKAFVAKCSDYAPESVENAVERIFGFFGGAEQVLKKGKRVLLKTNLLLARDPDSAATTHPEVVRAVASYLIAHGADVMIADSPGGPYTAASLKRVYEVCGMTRAAELSGASLNFDTSQHAKTVNTENGVKAFELIAPVVERDVIISCAKIKTHSLAYYTGAAKNMFGTIAGLNKAAYHANYPKIEDFSAMIVDLVRTVDPDYSIIDGVYGMEGDGPSAGTPKYAGVIIGAKNPFAADEAAMRQVGLDPELAPIQKRAKELKLVSDVEICGDDVPKTEFAPALRGKRVWNVLKIIPRSLSRAVGDGFKPYPLITDKCIGCGTCVRSCPGTALAVKDKKAVLNKKSCIRCYCCHELCPVKAIDLR